MTGRRAATCALAVVVATCVALPARAGQQETVTHRYNGADYWGWTAGNGGGYGPLKWPPPSIAVPAWATTVGIRVDDDQGRPVHGVASTRWGTYGRAQRAVICSGVEVTLPVHDSTELWIEIGIGFSTSGIDNGCLQPFSLPTTGTVTVTFRG